MNYYTVNATMTVAAWLDVEATSEEAALEAADATPASQWEYDMTTAEIEFNVTPQVEVSR